jgi:hypothetical protein
MDAGFEHKVLDADALGKFLVCAASTPHCVRPGPA